MDQALSKQLRNFTTLLVGVQAASIAAILGVFLIFNYYVKVRLANLAQQEARFAILVGDLRQAVRLLDDLRMSEFQAIRYVTASGKKLFSLPPEGESTSIRVFDVVKTIELKSYDGTGESLGHLEFVFSLFNGMGYALTAAVILVLSSIPLTNRYRRRLQSRYELELSARADSAVARMTHMLAHDVRRPFSILRMGLGMLNGAKDPTSVRNILSRLTPEIDKAVSSVDGLIADVMEVGSTSTQLIQEPASPESLVEAALSDIFRVYPNSDIGIAYSFKHTHMVNVHVQKVGRVFSNIAGNALQAMNYKGTIWFKTKERDGLVEFCVGNSGSVIPAENLPKLFDAFFTSGKKGGTGLGLAIAQKVVTAHGGRIWCESSKTLEHPDGKVEFYFTMPVAEDRRCQSTASLPLHSSEIRRALEAIAAPASDASVDKGELTLEADITEVRERLGRPLRVLVVDDEAVYRNALAAYLNRTPELVQSITIATASNAEGALEALHGQAFDLVITDVDMGPESLDGFELVRELRARGLQALVCVHSNRIVAADHQTAILAGANAFLPKPMARAQLLRLALQAAEKERIEKGAPTAAAATEHQGAIARGKPEVLVVDDNPFILDAWVDTLSAEAKIHVMTSLEDLDAKLASDAGFLNRLSFVVTDMYLDGSAGDGLDVGRRIKGARPDLRVLLSSDGDFTAADLVGAVDRVIGKDPVRFDALLG